MCGTVMIILMWGISLRHNIYIRRNCENSCCTVRKKLQNFQTTWNNTSDDKIQWEEDDTNQEKDKDEA